MLNLSELELHYDPYDPGDSSVGIQPSYPCLATEFKVDKETGLEDSSFAYWEVVPIAHLTEMSYILPRWLWTEKETKQDEIERQYKEHYGDYPIGTRFIANVDEVGKRMALMWNFCQNIPTTQLEEMEESGTNLFSLLIREENLKKLVETE